MTAARFTLLAVVILALRTVSPAALEQPPPDPNSLVGIGAVVHANGPYPTIGQIVKGGPADLEGHLKVNDQITGVAQGNADFVDCANLSVDLVVHMIRGAKGTTVRLRVIPAGAADPSKREVISIVRAELKVTPDGAVAIPPKPTPAPDAMKWSPEIEAKIAEIEKKTADQQRDELSKYMAKKIDDVAQATGIDDSVKKSLAAAAAQAVDQTLKLTGARLDHLVREELSIYIGQLSAEQSLAQLDSSGIATWIQDHGDTWPIDQPAWQQGLKQLLTAAQLDAWQAAETKRKAKAEAEIAGFLNMMKQFASEQVKPSLKTKFAQIQTDLKPPKDLLDKLNALVDAVAGRYGDGMRARAERGLLAMDDAARASAIRGQDGLYLWLDPEVTYSNPVNPVTIDWDASVAKILSPDVLKHLEDIRQFHMNLRAAACGKLLVALMDERLALTAAQRQQLEPIARTAIQSQPSLIEDRDMGDYYACSPGLFFLAASTAPEEEIKSILDPIQIAHWKDACSLRHEQSTVNMIIPRKLPAANAPATVQPAPEPDAVEAAISKYLADKSGAERDDLVADRELKAEDIARLLHLPDDALERLRTAARGEAEQSLLAWNLNADRQIRATLSGASPENVQQQLDNLQPYRFAQINRMLSMNPVQKDSVWDKTVNALLTPDQMKTWKQETDARAAYRTEAVAGFIVSGFDQGIGLSPDQWPKLEQLVAKVVDQYENDMARFLFSSSNAWFLNSNVMFVPFAGIPEADLKAALTPDQFQRWKSSDACNTATAYWSNVTQMHQQTAQMAARKVKVKVKVKAKPKKPQPSAQPSPSAQVSPQPSAPPSPPAQPSPSPHPSP